MVTLWTQILSCMMKSEKGMYSKCGDLTNARLIFEGTTERKTACWNAMISGFANHGQCEEALELFGRMES